MLSGIVPTVTMELAQQQQIGTINLSDYQLLLIGNDQQLGTLSKIILLLGRFFSNSCCGELFNFCVDGYNRPGTFMVTGFDQAV